MRWLIRLLFLLILFVGSGVLTFITTVWTQNEPLIVKSKLQGTKVIAPHSWAIFPERLIPRYVTISPIPSHLEVQGDLIQDFPYADILKEIEHYYLAIHFQVSKPISIQDIETSNKSISDIIAEWKNTIESILSEQMNSLLTADTTDFSAEKIKKSLSSVIPEGIKIHELNITHLPNIKDYIKFQNEVKQTLATAQTASKITALNLQFMENQKLLEIRQKNLSQALDIAIAESQKLTENKVDTAASLSLLGYLLDKDFIGATSDKNSK